MVRPWIVAWQRHGADSGNRSIGSNPQLPNRESLCRFSRALRRHALHGVVFLPVGQNHLRQGESRNSLDSECCSFVRGQKDKRLFLQPAGQGDARSCDSRDRWRRDRGRSYCGIAGIGRDVLGAVCQLLTHIPESPRLGVASVARRALELAQPVRQMLRSHEEIESRIFVERIGWQLLEMECHLVEQIDGGLQVEEAGRLGHRDKHSKMDASLSENDSENRAPYAVCSTSHVLFVGSFSRRTQVVNPCSRSQLERLRLSPQLHVHHLLGGAVAGFDRAHLDATDGPLHRVGHRSQLADRERAPALGDLVKEPRVQAAHFLFPPLASERVRTVCRWMTARLGIRHGCRVSG